jgi:hypothetical protein
MSLSDLASLGSFVSGLAVLASLVLLFLQMRQMTEQVRQSENNQRALMNQGVVNRSSDTFKWLAEPHMSDLISRMIDGETGFTGRELTQMRMRLRNTMVSVRDTYVQHKSGLVDEITFESALGSVTSLLAQPVIRALWKIDRTTYAPEWIAYIDGLINETPLASPADFVAQFKAKLAEVMH